jgi:uncharacterized integral membrane protein (TIGR00697 family)
MSQSSVFTNPYKAMPFLIMLYITLMLAANVVIYKLIIINGMVFSAGLFLIPLVHVLLDIISERYGYDFAKKIIFSGLVCQLVFALFCSYLIMIPSPIFWHYQADYDQVLGKLMRVFMGSFFGTSIGMMINAKLIFKWKILVKGKYFWMRCIGASAVGQLLFSIITITYDLYGIQPLGTIVGIIIPSYFFKMLFTCFAATPASIIVALLKVYEGSPSYELNYNPFLNIKSELSRTEMA